MDQQAEAIANQITRSPVVLPGDEDFLRDLYFSTREDLNLLPLDEAQKQAFITMQYAAQKQAYEIQFPGAEHDLILRDRIPAGRLLVDRGPNAIYLVDISLLPIYRGMGIGTAMMNELAEEANSAGTALRLHVLKTNPANHLYFRMGLTVTADDGLYLEMQKAPKSNILEDR
jgi:ribosomal protein S18 acetylase RimI-like enzyme